jgi:hypothetical protein
MENIYVIIQQDSEDPMCVYALKAFDCLEGARTYMVEAIKETFEKMTHEDKKLELDTDEIYSAEILYDDESSY